MPITANATPIADSVMETASNQRLFFTYVTPAVAAMVVNGIYAVVDGILIGHAIGAEGLAAVSLAWPLFGFLIGVGMMIGMGAGTLIGLRRGANNPAAAGQAIGNVFGLLLLASLILGPVVFFASPYLIALMGAADATLQNGIDYMNVFSISSIVLLANGALPLILRNGDKPSITTWIMVLGAVINLVVGFYLIVLLDMGLSGAALATIIAQGTVCLLCLYYITRPDWPIPFTSADLSPDAETCKTILSAGMPSLMMFGYFIFFMIVHNALFMHHGGVVAVAAFSIVSYFFAFYGYLAEGIATGIQPIISYHQGSGQQHRVIATIKMAMAIALGTGIVIVIITNLMPYGITHIFNNDDQALIEETVNGLRLHLILMFLDGLIFICGVYFQAIHKTKIAMWVNGGNIAVQIPVLMVLPLLWGLDGIWLALPLSNLIIAIPVAWLLWRDLQQRSHQISSIH